MTDFCSGPILEWTNGHFDIKVPTNVTGFTPFNHQTQAWDSLDQWFNSYKKEGGIIWIPTGGGKTVIAAKWLLENAIDKGDKVIWFAHRNTLLEQAATTFYRLLLQIPMIENKKIIRLGYVISSQFGGVSWNNIDLNADIVFASLSSSTKNQHFDKIQSFGNKSINRLFIVFDEVQHAYASTFRKLLEKIKKMIPSSKLIGLSATPYRMDKNESINLWRLFSSLNESNSKIDPVIRVLQQDLIDREILANPNFFNETTEIRPTVEKGKKLINLFNELDPEVYSNLGENDDRNKKICYVYINNFLNSKNEDERFGKTIIFTPSINGNQKLWSIFQQIIHKKGLNLKAEYIDSTLAHFERSKIIEKFRSSGPDRIDILINVEMCTEGFDVPSTKTVFLARPSNSINLVRQMMGRAMRGPKAGGNKNCNIVRFVDKLPPDYKNVDPKDVFEEEKRGMQTVNICPPDVITQYFKQFDFSIPIYCNLKYQYNYIPDGWFRLEKFEFEEENSIQIYTNPNDTEFKELYIMYLNYQLNGYKNIIELIKKGDRDRIKSLFYNEIIQKFFFDCPDPLPTSENIDNFIQLFPCNSDVNENEMLLEFNEKITINDFFENLLKSDNITSDTIGNTIFSNKSNKFLDNFYKNYEDLKEDLKKYLWYKENRILSKHKLNDLNLIQEYIKKDAKNDSKPHNFEKVLQDLLKTDFVKKILHSNHFPPIQVTDFFYRDHPIAFCRFTKSRPEFHISSKIQSQAIPRVVIEYILFHLYIHSIVPYEFHNQIFRGIENSFKPTDISENEIINLYFWNNLDYKPQNDSHHISWVEFCQFYLKNFIIYTLNLEVGDLNNIEIDDYL